MLFRSIEFDRLQSLRGGYVHDVFIHSNGSHNSWSDRDANGTLYPVLAQPTAWLKEGNQETVNKDTAAAHWLRQYTRNPYPSKIFWDPKTNAPRDVSLGAAYLSDDASKQTLATPNHLNYWLDLGSNPNLDQDLVIEAELKSADNAVSLRSLGSLEHLTVLLNPSMLNFDQDIRVSVDGVEIDSTRVVPDVSVMARTLLERGDINYMFSAELNLAKADDGSWTVSK